MDDNGNIQSYITPPINQADYACAQHDVDYINFRKKKSQGYPIDKLNEEVRASDQKLINAIKNNKEAGLSEKIVQQMMTGKVLLEDSGVIDRQQWVGEGVRKNKGNNSWHKALMLFHKENHSPKFYVPQKGTKEYKRVKQIQSKIQNGGAFNPFRKSDWDNLGKKIEHDINPANWW